MTNMLIKDKKQRNLRKTPLLLNFQFFLVSKDTWWLSLDLILFFSRNLTGFNIIWPKNEYSGISCVVSVSDCI